MAAGNTEQVQLYSIDGPFNDEGRLLYYGNSLLVKGWVNLADPARHLRIYCNDRPLTTVRPSEERPDVQKIYPDTPLTSGFTTEVSLDSVPAEARGDAIIKVQLEVGETILGTAAFSLALTDPQCILHIDSITVVNARIMVTTSNTTLVGWCVAQEEIAFISARIGSDLIFPVHYGIARADVFASHRNNPNGFHTGFSLFLAELPEGDSDVTFQITTRTNHVIRKSHVLHAVKGHRPPVGRVRLASEVRFWTQAARQYAALNWLVVITDDPERTYKPLPGDVEKTLAFLRRAERGPIVLLPAKWRNHAPNHADIKLYDSPVQLKRLLTQHKGDFVTCLNPGDTLDISARAIFQASQRKDAPIVYWDERAHAVGASSVIRKSPGAPFVTEFHGNLLGRGYAARLTEDVLSDLSQGVALRQSLTTAALLSFYNTPDQCIHIAEVLSTHVYDRPAGSVSTSDLHARQAALSRIRTRYGAVRLAPPDRESRPPAGLALRTAFPAKGMPLVSIIIATIGSRGRVMKCLHDIRERSTYKALEIIVLDHTRLGADTLDMRGQIRDLADKVLPVIGPFNWSRFNNMGGAVSRGDVLLFLNDDVEVVSESWIEELIHYLNFDRVGAAGPRLLLPDGNSIQSAGISLLDGEGWARNDFAFSGKQHPLADGVNLRPRNCTSLLGAAVAVRRDVFLSTGGFNEKLPLTFNDLDFHLRLREAGYQVVCTPLAELIHHERNSRAEITENPMEEAYWARWQHAHSGGDPYWHPARERESGLYKLDPEPVEPVWRAGVVASRHDINRILLLRLDHIGDFVLTLPAFHQLRKLFPNADIEIVVGKWNVDLAKQSHLFQAVHQLNLYNERSGDGRASSLAEADDEMARLLDGRTYDLAVDFRVDGDTRPLLQALPTQFRAGFSHGIRYPWLDISVEWEGNLPRWRQTANGAVKLQRLVSALEEAFPLADSEPALWPAATLAAKPAARSGPHAPLVVLHPFAGNAIKMWPAAHWVMLTELILRAGGSVSLVGSRGDRTTNADLVQAMVAAGAQDNLGSFTLTELLRYLASAQCFVGADSGPKHLAASVRIPTIGIQSGFVDPAIWGPDCDQGLSLIKRVSCSPCYFDDLAQCDRGHECMRKITPQAVFRYVSILTGLRTPQGLAGLAAQAEARRAARKPALPVTLPAE